MHIERNIPLQTIRKAELFKNGASQAVRLPAKFRFEGNEVYISRDEKTPNVILSTQPAAQACTDFFAFRDTVDIPKDWMLDRPLNRVSVEEEEPLFREDDSPMLYMLDTDVASYIINGGYERVDRIVARTLLNDLCISAMTRAELKCSLAAAPANIRLHTLIERFLGNMRLLVWGAEAADIRAAIKFQLRSAGAPIGDMDTLIAAHAIAGDAVLVTDNTHHFEPIKLR